MGERATPLNAPAKNAASPAPVGEEVAEIRHEMAATRAQMAETLGELHDKLAPSAIKVRARAKLYRLLPVALSAVGLALMLEGWRRYR